MLTTFIAYLAFMLIVLGLGVWLIVANHPVAGGWMIAFSLLSVGCIEFKSSKTR
jgi:ABC-type protease/lipase transport system fused ATPase/permease subunit